jgi:hypothetical protein
VAEQMPDVETIKSFNTGLVEEFRADGGKVGGTYKGAEPSASSGGAHKRCPPRPNGNSARSSRESSLPAKPPIRKRRSQIDGEQASGCPVPSCAVGGTTKGVCQ